MCSPEIVGGFGGSVRLCHSNSGLRPTYPKRAQLEHYHFILFLGCYLRRAVYLLCSLRIILAFLPSLAKARILLV